MRGLLAALALCLAVQAVPAGTAQAAPRYRFVFAGQEKTLDLKLGGNAAALRQALDLLQQYPGMQFVLLSYVPPACLGDTTCLADGPYEARVQSLVNAALDQGQSAESAAALGQLHWKPALQSDPDQAEAMDLVVRASRQAWSASCQLLVELSDPELPPGFDTQGHATDWLPLKGGADIVLGQRGRVRVSSFDGEPYVALPPRSDSGSAAAARSFTTLQLSAAQLAWSGEHALLQLAPAPAETNARGVGDFVAPWPQEVSTGPAPAPPACELRFVRAGAPG